MHGRFLNTSLLFSFWRCCDHWRKLPKWNMALLRLALWTHTERKKNFFLTARLGHFFSLASVETGLLFFLAQWELAFELESNSVDTVDCCRKWLVNFITWKLSFFHLTDLITLPLLNLSHLTEPLTERLLRWKWMGLLLKKSSLKMLGCLSVLNWIRHLDGLCCQKCLQDLSYSTIIFSLLIFIFFFIDIQLRIWYIKLCRSEYAWQ